MDNKWHKAKVIKGQNLGSKLGFPTVNLDNPDTLKGQEKGVYATEVKIGNSIFSGALFYGPRLVLGEKENILEIFILDFNKKIYGETVSFRLIKFIRLPENFPNPLALKKRLEKDVQEIRLALSHFSKK